MQRKPRHLSYRKTGRSREEKTTGRCRHLASSSYSPTLTKGNRSPQLGIRRPDFAAEGRRTGGSSPQQGGGCQSGGEVVCVSGRNAIHSCVTGQALQLFRGTATCHKETIPELAALRAISG